MEVYQKILDFRTGKSPDLVDFMKITEAIQETVKESGIDKGICSIYSMHTTACIKITENCRLAHKDAKLYLETTIPRCKTYAHDWIEFRDVPPEERINGVSHVRQLQMNTSETVPVRNGELLLGKWQDIFLVDLDPMRERRVIVSVVGE